MTNSLNNKICRLITLIFLMLFCVSCASNSEVHHNFPFKLNSKEIKICLLKSKGKEDIHFIVVKRRVPQEESLTDAVLKELFLGPTQEEELRGIMTEIPQGTRLVKVEESEDEVLIDISSQFLTGGGSATMQLRYLQLYKTLRNVAPGKKIYLMVDGKNVKTIGGEGLEVNQPLSKINDYRKKYEKTDNLQP